MCCPVSSGSEPENSRYFAYIYRWTQLTMSLHILLCIAVCSGSVLLLHVRFNTACWMKIQSPSFLLCRLVSTLHIGLKTKSRALMVIFFTSRYTIAVIFIPPADFFPLLFPLCIYFLPFLLNFSFYFSSFFLGLHIFFFTPLSIFSPPNFCRPTIPPVRGGGGALAIF
jgi:hypothetical protein